MVRCQCVCPLKNVAIETAKKIYVDFTKHVLCFYEHVKYMLYFVCRSNYLCSKMKQ